MVCPVGVGHGFDTLVTNAVHFEEEGVELPDPVSHDTSMETIGEWARQFYKDNERFGLAVSFAEAGQSHALPRL